jgi:hypothetical protein
MSRRTSLPDLSRPLDFIGMKESIETTQTYLHAHLALKEDALAKLDPGLHACIRLAGPDDQAALAAVGKGFTPPRVSVSLRLAAALRSS